MFKGIQHHGPPLVLIDRRFDDLDTNYVGADDEMIGVFAVEHLIEIGCKRIAHLRGPETSAGIGRLNGYIKTLAKYRMKLLPGYVFAPGTVDVHSTETGAELTKRLLGLNPRPDGIFAYNDPMAIGAIEVILDAGLRVPEDVAVIGSGNLYYHTLNSVFHSQHRPTNRANQGACGTLDLIAPGLQSPSAKQGCHNSTTAHCSCLYRPEACQAARCARAKFESVPPTSANSANHRNDLSGIWGTRMPAVVVGPC